MRRILVPVLLTVATAAAAASTPTTPPVVGLPCEDCEAALDGLPADPPNVARLAPLDEPGERLRLTGRVTDASGRPRAGVVVYAHQTNREGVYPPGRGDLGLAARRHGRLRAWAATDADGRYTFLTVRPGSYPGSSMPQHIHLHVLEPSCALYYIDDVLFRDDPHLTRGAMRAAGRGRGGSGVVTPTRIDGEWQARRDIVLGENVPGYPGCEPR